MNCLYCGAPLDSALHGNKRYCPGKDCYYLNKKARGKNLYKSKKATSSEVNRNEKLLELFFEAYGSDYMPAAILNSAKFDWDVCTETTTKEDRKAKIINKYGYTLYDNKTVKIFKI